MFERIELEQAIELINQYCKPIKETERVDIDYALNRVLANDIYSPLSQPPFNKSAMDGYAFHYEDTLNASKENPVHLEVIDTVYAGDYCTKEIKRGQAIQIMTGGCVPSNLTAVLRQEDTNDDPRNLEIYVPSKYMDCICIEGEDFKKGDLLLKKGTKLDSVCLAILSSVGIERVEVYRLPKIALMVTGSEVTSLGLPLEPGRIYDSNYMMFNMRLKELGYPCTYSCRIVDCEKACATHLESFSEKYDLIFTTGGVSVGKKDILHPGLDLCHANKIFWRLKLKPGSPTVFSVLNGVPILSLSGNPFAAICIFELLGRIALSKISNDSTLICKKATAILETDFPKKSGQRRFIRAKYQNGHVEIPSGMHSNNELKALIGCNALIDVEKGNMGLSKNDKVEIWIL